MTVSLQEDGHVKIETYKRIPYDDRGRYFSYAVASQEMPRKPEKDEEEFSLQASEVPWPC